MKVSLRLLEKVGVWCGCGRPTVLGREGHCHGCADESGWQFCILSERWWAASRGHGGVVWRWSILRFLSRILAAVLYMLEPLKECGTSLDTKQNDPPWKLRVLCIQAIFHGPGGQQCTPAILGKKQGKKTWMSQLWGHTQYPYLGNIVVDIKLHSVELHTPWYRSGILSDPFSPFHFAYWLLAVFCLFLQRSKSSPHYMFFHKCRTVVVTTTPNRAEAVVCSASLGREVWTRRGRSSGRRQLRNSESATKNWYLACHFMFMMMGIVGHKMRKWSRLVATV